MSLEEIFHEYYPIISGFFGLIIFLLGLTLKSYFSEKGKLEAQKQENKKLVEQTEKIKSDFNKELEELKKEHQLDISKRKYQYESKKDAYVGFFKLLDTFSNDQMNTTQEKFKENIDEFNRNYLNGRNQKSQNQATIIFSKKTQKLSADSYKDFQKLRQETNTIRMIASDEVLEKLKFLDFLYEKSMEKSNKIMSSLPALMLTNNQEKMKSQQRELEIDGMVISKTKDELIEMMRQELNKI